MQIKYPILAFSLCLATNSLHGYKQDKNVIKITKSKRLDAFSPEKELASFTLPDGFVIELVASEENGIINPIDLTFDDAGRLWTQTAEMYPLDPFGNKSNGRVRAKLLDPKSGIKDHPGYKKLDRLYKLKDKGTDRVLLIDDPTKQVKGKVKIVADGLTMPQSILPYKNGVYVAHGSEMLYIEDLDNDGHYETAKSVLSGFSFIDSHTMSHCLVRGPGGWVHFSHGAMNLGKVTALESGDSEQVNYSKIARFSLDGKKIELVSSGLNNIWGFQLRGDGQWYGTEANDKSHSVVPMEPMTGFLGIGNDKLRSYQPMVPVVHKFRVGGTGISGLAISDDDSNTFPGKWKDVGFLANPITNTINTVKIDRDEKGNIIATHMEDLLKSTDDWFRPVNIEFGPDGCLYIADWYNKVVSHNEIARTDPSRDKTHGRIWRIRHKSQKPGAVPNLLKVKDEDLVKHLLGNSRWEKRAAWHQISDRQVTSIIPKIEEIALDVSASISSRVHAIWSIESLGMFNENLLTKLLNDENHNVRREAIRSLTSYDLEASLLARLVKPSLNDEHCLVRSQVLRTLDEANKPNQAIIELLVSACKPGALDNSMGGNYERNFERFLARKALEKYTTSLVTYLDSDDALNQPVNNIIWAIQSLPREIITSKFAKFWKLRKEGAIDADTFISVSEIINSKEISEITKAYFNDTTNFQSLLKLVLENEDRVNLVNIAKPLEPAVKALISSSSDNDRSLAMQVATKLKMSVINQEVIKLATEAADKHLSDILSVLLLDPKANEGILKTLTENDSLSFGDKLKAIGAYNSANAAQAAKTLKVFIKDKTPAERKIITSYFSKSARGSRTMVSLTTKGLFTLTEFDLASAQRIHAALMKDKVAIQILQSARQVESKRVAGLEQKVANYIKAINTGKGDIVAGKAIFQTCLACHQVGEEGFEIAPALDGSASRELHALITAIVNPDVAVEGGYNLHRVTKKDGTTIEGYLFKKTPQGVTIALMGNAQFFIPASEIKSEASVPGKSFMPSIFGDLPDQTMVDLISYINTLK